MKRVKLILACVNEKIKKYFFKEQKTDNYHACRELLEADVKTGSDQEKRQVEEYLKNYSLTTRWQTV